MAYLLCLKNGTNRGDTGDIIAVRDDNHTVRVRDEQMTFKGMEQFSQAEKDGFDIIHVKGTAAEVIAEMKKQDVSKPATPLTEEENIELSKVRPKYPFKITATVTDVIADKIECKITQEQVDDAKSAIAIKEQP